MFHAMFQKTLDVSIERKKKRNFATSAGTVCFPLDEFRATAARTESTLTTVQKSCVWAVPSKITFILLAVVKFGIAVADGSVGFGAFVQPEHRARVFHGHSVRCFYVLLPRAFRQESPQFNWRRSLEQSTGRSGTRRASLPHLLMSFQCCNFRASPWGRWQEGEFFVKWRPPAPKMSRQREKPAKRKEVQPQESSEAV
jgi:hypothetical protein